MRLLTACISLAFVLVLGSCTRNNESGNESLFYGTWVKGSNAGDTLQFMRKGDKNIMRSNQSFNSSMTAYQEVEYRYMNGKLAVEFAGPGSELRTLESFSWKTTGREFELLGFQLFLFMSSSTTKFAYTKIN